MRHCGLVDWVSRAAVREHVVLTGCLSSIPVIYSFTSDNDSRLLIRRLKQTNQYTPQQADTSKWSDAYRAKQVSSATKIYVSRGLRCSHKATDKPNMAVNACQKLHFWYRIYVQSRLAKMACEYVNWPLTTAKVEILQYNLLAIKFQLQCRNRAFFRR